MRGGEATQGVLTSTTYQHCLLWGQNMAYKKLGPWTLALDNSDCKHLSLLLPLVHNSNYCQELATDRVGV